MAYRYEIVRVSDADCEGDEVPVNVGDCVEHSDRDAEGDAETLQVAVLV